MINTFQTSLFIERRCVFLDSANVLAVTMWHERDETKELTTLNEKDLATYDYLIKSLRANEKLLFEAWNPMLLAMVWMKFISVDGYRLLGRMTDEQGAAISWLIQGIDFNLFQGMTMESEFPEFSRIWEKDIAFKNLFIDGCKNQRINWILGQASVQWNKLLKKEWAVSVMNNAIWKMRVNVLRWIWKMKKT